jgi:Holliday junction resolvase-like predicted endonuclease
MEREMARKAKFGMDPIPPDPRIEVMYPGMTASEKVKDAVEVLRDTKWETLNDQIRNNEPPSAAEIEDLVERKPYLNIDNPDILAREIKQSRMANLMYSKKGQPSFAEVQAAKNFVITDGITPENKKKLEQAADAWREEKGSWAGWEERRQAMIVEMVEGNY